MTKNMIPLQRRIMFFIISHYGLGTSKITRQKLFGGLKYSLSAVTQRQPFQEIACIAVAARLVIAVPFFAQNRAQFAF